MADGGVQNSKFKVQSSKLKGSTKERTKFCRRFEIQNPESEIRNPESEI
jgi:hypothetical protein